MDHKLQIILAAKDVTGPAFNKFQGRIKSITQSIFSLQGGLVSLGVGYGFSKLSKDLIGVASSFEQMQIKLDALTNGRGKQTLEELNTWALEMPVNTRKAVDTFVMMQAMGLDPTIAKMQTLTDVASIFGQEAMPRVARALGQMATLGRLSAEELNQMSEAGINARKYLTEAFGMTVEQLQKSEISIKQIIDAIWRGLNSDYSGSAARAQDSWAGLVTTFESYMTEMARQVMNAGVFEELKTQLGEINKLVSSWATANRELMAAAVPAYIDKIKGAISKLYNILTYDPAILEYGLVGLLIWGKKGAVILGGLAHLSNVLIVQAEAFKGLVTGQLSLGDIATANYKELKKLVAGMGEYNGQLGQAHGNINRMGDALQKAHKAGIIPPRKDTNSDGGNDKDPKPVDTIERLLVPQKQWTSLKAATKPGLDQLRSVREAAEEEAKAYAEEFQATVEIYSGDIIPQGVIDAQLTRMVEAAKEGAKNFVQPFENAFLSMGDALGDFVMSGKADIKSLLTSILSDLVHMETRMMAMSIFSGLGGSISGGGGGGSGSIGAIWSLLKHAGGTVDGSGPRRLVSPSTFAFAPRLHNGLRGDEYPAILQKGETVLPRGVGGGGDVDVIINNYSGQPASVQGSNDGPGGRRQIAVIIGEEFASGRLDKTMSQNYNLRRGGRTV